MTGPGALAAGLTNRKAATLLDHLRTRGTGGGATGSARAAPTVRHASGDISRGASAA